MAASTAIILNPVRGDVLSKRDDWLAGRDALLAESAEVRRVADDETLHRAGSIYTDARRHVKALEQARKAVTEPNDAVTKQIMAKDRVASVFGAAATVGMANVPTVSAPKSSANRMVERWSFEVLDSAAIPREFLSVDEGKIRAWMQAQTKLGITPQLPGVAFEKTVFVEAK